MGILTELVIANVHEAEDVARDIAKDTDPNERRPGLDADGLDQVKLSTLRSIVTNQEYQDAWIDEFRFLAGNQEEGPWVFAMPEALISALAASPEGRLKAVAKQWSRTEEVKMDEWSIEDVETRLKHLIALAKDAKRTKKSILMRVSL
jgi:hypothetical protein